MPGDKQGQGKEMKVTNGFKDSVGLLFSLRLSSLKVECPRCGKRGLAMTKWVKGRAVKPLYVLHRNNGRGISECHLKGDDSEAIRRDVGLSARDLRKIVMRAKTFVLFSGGADSLCTLLYMQEVCANDGENITALHVDTTAGFPEVTKYVRRTCRKLGIPLNIVSPNRDYFELAKKWGIPSFSSRWCCKELKVKPVRDFLAKLDGEKVIVDGIRAAESAQRSTYVPIWYHPTFRCLSVSPILRWSHEDVQSYLEESGLPQGPAKELGCSAECWCGAYKKRPDFEKLLDIHPEIFDKLVEVEKAQKGRYTFLYEDGRKVPLSSVKKGKRQSNRKNHQAKTAGT